MKKVSDENITGYNGNPVRIEKFIVTSLSLRRALRICENLKLYMKGSKKKNHLRWIGDYRASYSRRRRILYLTKTTVEKDTTLTVGQLDDELNEIETYYYESGSYYDLNREDYEQGVISNLESEHKFSHVEF